MSNALINAFLGKMLPGWTRRKLEEQAILVHDTTLDEIRRFAPELLSPNHDSALY